MKTYTIYQVDAFTTEKFKGNPAGVVTNADGLSEKTMQIVSTGHSKVMLGIKSRTKLNSLSPDMDMLRNFSTQIGCNGYFVFTLTDDTSEIVTHGRMFAPAIGIEEDPVTGNANGPLGAYLVKHKIVKNDNFMFVFTGIQGEAILREGKVHVKVKIKNGEPTQVQIGGTAVIAFKTQITL